MCGDRFLCGIKKIVLVFAIFFIVLVVKMDSFSKINVFANTTSPTTLQAATPDPDTTSQATNAVYEQIELISLVFRLAGHGVFSDEFTDYQRSLLLNFSAFANHPVVECTNELTQTRGIGYDAPILLAIHLEKVDQQFHFMQGARIWESDDRWTPEIADDFLVLLNDFYIDSNFGAFFEEHMPYYEYLSRRLHGELLGQINFDWFYQFGFGPENIRITVRPSGSQGGFGPTLLDTVNYAVLPITDYFGDFHEFAVHEFAHSFANDIADAWYEESADFRQLSEASVDMRRMPWYGQSWIMAREYVTRAYTILYMVENHDKDLLNQLIGEYTQGFRNIETVYAMITEHEPMITQRMRFFALLSRNMHFGNPVFVAVIAAFVSAIVSGGVVGFVGRKLKQKKINAQPM